ncbi:MAG: hypothetical protein PHQ04_01805 [Opitutaceae bacterium]|nr:hypothetical protein [Opitutaceae bacterium]
MRGARANALPGIVLQIVALALVLAYYHHPPSRALLEQLADFRRSTGFGFSIASTGLFGGLLPFLYIKLNPRTAGRYCWSQGAAFIIFWAYKGFEIDLFYRLLAHSVGAEASPITVTAKVLLDQFVYCPVYAIPGTVLLYEWTEVRFAMARVAADIRTGGWYYRRVLPALLSNIGVWVPATAIIYTLPTPLQLPLQNVVLFFFTLLLAHLTARRAQEDCPREKNRPGLRLS